MTDGPSDVIRRALEQALSARPDLSERDLNAVLAQVTSGYNNRPQADLGGRSPDEVHRFIAADWASPDSAIRLDDSLELDALVGAPALHDARLVLALLAERAPVKATPKGNLPRAFVTAFQARAGSYAAARELEFPLANARNEEDHWPLHITRLLLELERLIARRKGLFTRTRNGDRLLRDALAGPLYTRLLRATFRTLNLAYLDGAGDAPDLQHTIGFTLAQFDRHGDAWHSAENLAADLVLPSVRAAIPLRHGWDPLPLMLSTRFLSPLERFGLAESRETGSPVPGLRSAEFRKSPLFARVISIR